MIRPDVRVLTVGCAATLAIAGCGGGSSSTYSKASTSSSSASTSAPPATPAASSVSPAAAQTATIISTKHSKLGTIVAAGPKHMTVYLFEGDKGASSSCAGACASVWPPVIASGSPTASGAGMSADLGTIKRADGITQVTYKGHPLYFFVRDKDSGDAYGQGVKGFGADWYVLSPSGSKVDHS